MKIILLGFVSPPVGAFLFAQSSPEFDPISLLGQIGLGAIFAVPWFYLWRDERKQRIASEDRERQLTRETVPLLSRAVEVLHEVEQGVEGTVRRAAESIPDRSESDLILRRAENLTGELGDLVKGLRQGDRSPGK